MHLFAPWPCKPGVFCSLGIDRRTGMTGSLHCSGCIQPGKIPGLVVSITCQRSNSLLKTEKPRRNRRFCEKRRFFLRQLRGVTHFTDTTSSTAITWVRISQVSRWPLVSNGKERHPVWASNSIFSNLRAVHRHQLAQPCNQGRSGVLSSLHTG